MYLSGDVPVLPQRERRQQLKEHTDLREELNRGWGRNTFRRKNWFSTGQPVHVGCSVNQEGKLWVPGKLLEDSKSWKLKQSDNASLGVQVFVPLHDLCIPWAVWRQVLSKIPLDKSTKVGKNWNRRQRLCQPLLRTKKPLEKMGIKTQQPQDWSGLECLEMPQGQADPWGLLGLWQTRDHSEARCPSCWHPTV